MIDPFCSAVDTGKTQFYGTSHFMVLYNIRPIAAGHSLFVPVRHVERITELTDKEAKDLNRVMKEVIPVLIRFYGSEDNSYNLAVQSGPYSGRTIDHLHIHIIPRKPDDKYQKRGGGLKVDISESLEDLGPEHVSAEIARLRKYFGYSYQKG
jgi:bis(5'-adenosyl)-triphosphatase